ncbi:MAG: hypothetical protein CSA38_02560 [Flavobacteriales bacterium]|nr:MAG: hypothetical protein CSA38_02560 [Flavobacteriales bacterium]
MNIRKITYILGAFLIISLLQSCPDRYKNREDIAANIAEYADLITITPLQQIYQQGDEIVLKITVDATNTYFGGEAKNLHQITGNDKARLNTSIYTLFEDNEFEMIKGSQGESINEYYLLYNPTNGKYELEIKIILTTTGINILNAKGFIHFKGSDKYNSFFLDTNVEGMDEQGLVAFKVLP